MPGDPRAKFRIVGDNSDYRRALKESQRDTQTFASSVGGALKVGAVAGAAAIAGAAVAIRTMAAEAARNADSLAKQADVLGITTQKLAAYRHAADLTGAGQENLDKGIKKLQKSIVDATNGLTTYTRAFDKLQLDPEQLKRMAPDEQFEAVGKALAGVETQAERVAIAYDLFGGRNTALLNTLVLTGEQLNAIEADTKAWGNALSRVDARQIERANDAVNRAQTATQGIATNIALAIAPIREGLANAFADAARESNGFKSEINTAIESLVIGANFLRNAINGIRLAWLGVKLAALETARAVADAIGTIDYDFVSLREGFRKNPNAGASRELIESLDATGAAIDDILTKFQSGDEALAKFREAVAASAAAAAASLEGEGFQGGGDSEGVEGPNFFTDTQREQLAARLAALQSTLLAETEAIIAAREERLALADEAFEADLLTFEEREALKADIYKQAQDKLVEIDRRRLAQQYALEAQAQATLLSLRRQAADNAIQTLQLLGQRSKTLARAAFIAERAYRVTEIIISTNAAVARAMAEIPYPANFGVAAAVAASGYALAAATAATAFGSRGGGSQTFSASGSSSASISSGVDSLSGPDAEQAFGQAPRRVVNVTIAGSLLAGQDTLDSLKSWIRDLTDADEVIISGNSRQAQELRGTT